MDSDPIPLDRARLRLQAYLSLSKPGIIMGNSITAAAGFALASRGTWNGWLFLATLLGLAFIIGAACTLNNYIDRFADEKMSRTKNRPLVKGTISLNNAIRFALILGFCGTGLLICFTNLPALGAALVGLSIYVFLYSFWKYRSVYSTLIGSIAGATPPVVGYAAVTESLDLGALLLFSLVTLWQIPHFFAIALYRLNDYKAAEIPVLPAVKGIHATKVQMLLYTVAFAIAAILPALFHFTGVLYLILSAIIALFWIALALRGFWIKNEKIWARQMFLFSLVAIMTLCFMIAIDVQ